MSTVRFAHCHVDGGTIWCKHWNGKWVGFPVYSRERVEPENAKPLLVKEEVYAEKKVEE